MEAAYFLALRYDHETKIRNWYLMLSTPRTFCYNQMPIRTIMHSATRYSIQNLWCRMHTTSATTPKWISISTYQPSMRRVETIPTKTLIWTRRWAGSKAWTKHKNQTKETRKGDFTLWLKTRIQTRSTRSQIRCSTTEQSLCITNRKSKPTKNFNAKTRPHQWDCLNCQLVKIWKTMQPKIISQPCNQINRNWRWRRLLYQSRCRVSYRKWSSKSIWSRKRRSNWPDSTSSCNGREKCYPMPTSKRSRMRVISYSKLNSSTYREKTQRLRLRYKERTETIPIERLNSR